MDLFEYAQKIKEESAQPPQTKPAEAIYSVSEVTLEIKELIVNRFGKERFWVKGEISNYKGRNQSGHMYFRLKDSSAILNCVYFRGSNSKLKFDLKEGMEILMLGRMDLYEKGGNYQLIVEDARQGGVGELFLKFELLKKKLETDGWFAPERKKALPQFPRRIGLVTSPTGAVIRDMIHVIKSRCPHAHLFLYPVKVQGDGAAQEIAKAIRDLNASNLSLDVLIVGRGGGSIEDLWAFNEEVVAQAIFESALPIVSAVGHQTDFTIADFVADVRAATPSQAAEMVVPNMVDLQNKVLQLMKSIVRELIHYRELSRQKLMRLTQAQVLKNPKYIVESKIQQVDSLMERLTSILTTKHKDVRERNLQAQRLLKMLLEKFVQPKKLRFERLGSNLALLNPLSILSRGYSVVQSDQGKIIKKSTEVSVGDVLNVRLHEGELLCSVTKTSKN